MSGRYPYGIGNPPTLRRSSFPQRALRPAGDPIPTLGAVPQDPLTLKLRLDTNDVNIVRTAPQIRSQGVCGAFYVEIVDGEGSRGLGRGPPIGRGSSFADYKVFA